MDLRGLRSIPEDLLRLKVYRGIRKILRILGLSEIPVDLSLLIYKGIRKDIGGFWQGYQKIWVILKE